MIYGLFALVGAALFTGAAFYINFAEHPARRGLPPAYALAQWQPAYHRGLIMQSVLAVVGGALAVAAWLSGAGWPMLAGAFALLANWPFTLVFIMPVNKLLAAQATAPSDDIAPLMRRWNRLHAGRTVLGLLATTLLLFGNLQHTP